MPGVCRVCVCVNVWGGGGVYDVYVRACLCHHSVPLLLSVTVSLPMCGATPVFVVDQIMHMV